MVKTRKINFLRHEVDAAFLKFSGLRIATTFLDNNYTEKNSKTKMVKWKHICGSLYQPPQFSCITITNMTTSNTGEIFTFLTAIVY